MTKLKLRRLRALPAPQLAAEAGGHQTPTNRDAEPEIDAHQAEQHQHEAFHVAARRPARAAVSAAAHRWIELAPPAQQAVTHSADSCASQCLNAAAVHPQPGSAEGCDLGHQGDHAFCRKLRSVAGFGPRHLRQLSKL